MNKSVRWFLSAVSAILNGREAPAPDAELDLPLVTRLAAFIHFDNFLYYIKQSAGLEIGSEENDRFIQNVMLDADQSTALSELLARLPAAGIEVIPLKGSRLKSLYPMTDMRYMGDIDLLYRGDDDALLSVMTELGYRPKSWKVSEVHHVFVRDRVTIELHHRLLHPRSPFGEPLASLWERVVPAPETSGVFDLSPTDFYLHLLSHAIMHMLEGGTGIRTFIDFGLFLRLHPELLGDATLAAALDREGLAAFEARARRIAAIILDGAEPSEEDALAIGGLLRAGIFGTGVGFAARTMSRSESEGGSASRGRYILSRLFPSLSDLAYLYPYLRRGGPRSLLYPVFWVRRLCAILFHKDRRARIGRGLSAASSVGADELAAVRFEQAYFGVEMLAGKYEGHTDEE